MSYVVWRRRRSMVWSTVSNTAKRSCSISTANSSRSSVQRMLAKHKVPLHRLRWSMSWWATRVFDNTDKLDIGRYHCGSDGSKLALLRRGVMTAVLNVAGNMRDITDLLNSVITNGANRSTLSLTKRVSNGCMAHWLFGHWQMVAVTSAMHCDKWMEGLTHTYRPTTQNSGPWV